MNIENVGETVNDQDPEVRMTVQDDPRMTESIEEPSVDTALGDWTRLSLENQYVYKFEVKETVEGAPSKGSKKSKIPVQPKTFAGEYVRKSVLGGFHPYAPLQPHGTANTGHDAYYVKIPNGFLRSNFNDTFVKFSIEWPKTELEFKGDMYVSLRYLQALAENNVAWNP